jgi:hypothetical protein
MMRQADRQSRLGSARTDVRTNALWGGGKKLALVLATFLVTAAAGLAAEVGGAGAANSLAYTSPGLLAEAGAAPDASFAVIVQGNKDRRTSEVSDEVQGVLKDEPSKGSKLTRKFVSISGVAATLTGKQILKLAEKSWIESITRDTKLTLSAYTTGQVWPSAAGVADTWSALPAGTSYPTIAIVDSGMTALTTFGTRLVKSVNLVTDSSTGGAYGHGTFVGSIAAGEDPGFAGAEPHAKVVSLKVLDGAGNGS